MNHGTAFFAPLNVAIAISGLVAGLDPPTLGCAWHARQLFELKRAPSPLFRPPVTVSIWTNLVSPSWKNAVSSRLSPFRAAPAPGAAPRTPGSTGAGADGPGVLAHDVNVAATIPAAILQTNDCLIVICGADHTHGIGSMSTVAPHRPPYWPWAHFLRAVADAPSLDAMASRSGRSDPPRAHKSRHQRQYAGDPETDPRSCID